MYTKDTRVNLQDRDSVLQEDLKNVRDKFSETREAINQTARDAKSRASDFIQNSLHDLNDKRADWQDNIVTYVKANPVKAVGIAVTFGLILSKLLRK